MGRLRIDTLERVESYSDRVLDVAEELEAKSAGVESLTNWWVLAALFGANTFEADQAVSSKDFAKNLGIVVKELNETKFWLRRVVRRGWIRQARLQPLLSDTDEWLAIFNRMIVKTRANDLAKKRTQRSAAR